MNKPNPYQAPQSQVAQTGDDVFDETSPFSPSGRFGRLRYFAYLAGFSLLVYLVLAALVGVSSLMLGSSEIMIVAGILYFVGMITILVLSFIFWIRRLHDLNWSGWLSLLMLVPLANFILSLILLFMPGTSGVNDYGPPSKPGSNAVLIIVLVLVVGVAVLGILAAIAIPAYQEYINRAQELNNLQ